MNLLPRNVSYTRARAAHTFPRRPPRNLGTCAALALLLASAPPADAQQGPLTLDDLGRITELRHPSISPDGRTVVMVRGRTDYEEDRVERSLLLIDLETGDQTEITPERPRVADPHWSPAGDRLAFLDAAEERAMQLHILPMGGGEARPLTSGEEGVRFYEWSPDGRWIVFGRVDPPEKKEGEERHNRSFEVGDNSYLTRAEPRPTHLWRIHADGGEPERLTEGPESVDEFAWAPDGRSLAVRVRPTPHTGAGIRSEIQLLDVATRERQVLVPGQGYSLRFSPDGGLLAFRAPRGAEPGFVPDAVFVVPVNGGEPRAVTPGIDRDLDFATWLPDGSGLLVKGPDITRTSVWLQPLDGPARALDLGPANPVTDLFLDENGRTAFIGIEPYRPPELYVMSGPGWAPRRVTDLNADIASREQGRMETLTWPGPDGFELSGVLTYPVGYESGSTYPLVLLIHGGPMGTSTETFGPVVQAMAARGWLVFQPNYRGSNNQGVAFQRAVVNDAGDGPGSDVMSGVELLKRRGLVDQSRIAVSGWSYGGFMTVWLTAHYEGWAAAVAGAPVTDWFDWYSMADLNTWAGYGLGGSPWLDDNAANYWRQSPIAYAHQIRTPMLILSTTGDERVTVSQSYKLYHALKDNEVEVRFIAYPVGGHFPPDPVHQRDVFRRWMGWIENHFERAVPRGGEGPRSGKRETRR